MFHFFCDPFLRTRIGYLNMNSHLMYSTSFCKSEIKIFLFIPFMGLYINNYIITCLCRLKKDVHGKGYARINWTYWFKKILYYQVAIVYVLTRLITNVSQVSNKNHVNYFILHILWETFEKHYINVVHYLISDIFFFRLHLWFRHFWLFMSSMIFKWPSLQKPW